MGPSESSNNGLLLIKYRKIDHGKSKDFFPIIFRDEFPQKSLKRWVVSLSSDTPIKHPPDPALICHKMALKYLTRSPLTRVTRGTVIDCFGSHDRVKQKVTLALIFSI